MLEIEQYERLLGKQAEERYRLTCINDLGQGYDWLNNAIIVYEPQIGRFRVDPFRTIGLSHQEIVMIPTHLHASLNFNIHKLIIVNTFTLSAKYHPLVAHSIIIENSHVNEVHFEYTEHILSGMLCTIDKLYIYGNKKAGYICSNGDLFTTSKILGIKINTLISNVPFIINLLYSRINKQYKGKAATIRKLLEEDEENREAILNICNQHMLEYLNGNETEYIIDESIQYPINLRLEKSYGD